MSPFFANLSPRHGSAYFLGENSSEWSIVESAGPEELYSIEGRIEGWIFDTRARLREQLSSSILLSPTLDIKIPRSAYLLRPLSPARSQLDHSEPCFDSDPFARTAEPFFAESPRHTTVDPFSPHLFDFAVYMDPSAQYCRLRWKSRSTQGGMKEKKPYSMTSTPPNRRRVKRKLRHEPQVFETIARHSLDSLPRSSSRGGMSEAPVLQRSPSPPQLLSLLLPRRVAVREAFATTRRERVSPLRPLLLPAQVVQKTALHDTSGLPHSSVSSSASQFDQLSEGSSRRGLRPEEFLALLGSANLYHARTSQHLDHPSTISKGLRPATANSDDSTTEDRTHGEQEISADWELELIVSYMT
ncbi:hypothetical protein NM688_g2313 [Phlebia brevispora]|uniref:Uncharacterized protein n=1 Tax=Phlebia brevispora TaxID=194682 RepID=A0ACC1T9N0_9APHY|nr:hypothetical protein NM688_g2313 [Phlebia brevispora]